MTLRRTFRPHRAALAAALCLAATSAPADFLGIPLERQPFIKFCRDGSIVASLGPNRGGEPADQYGAIAYDGRTGRAEALKRDRSFNARLAANPCVNPPDKAGRGE